VMQRRTSPSPSCEGGGLCFPPSRGNLFSVSAFGGGLWTFVSPLLRGIIPRCPQFTTHIRLQPSEKLSCPTAFVTEGVYNQILFTQA